MDEAVPVNSQKQPTEENKYSVMYIKASMEFLQKPTGLRIYLQNVIFL